MITNQDITDVAFRLFAEKGFYETTTENIAQILGLKKQSLYSHFKSKNDIIAAVLCEHMANITKVIDEIMSDYRDKPAEILLKFIFIRLSVFLSQRDRLLFWKRIFLFERNGEFSDILMNDEYNFHKKLCGELRGILLSRYPQFDDTEKLSSFFLSYMILINGYLDWMLVAGFDINTVETTWANFWNGIKSIF